MPVSSSCFTEQFYRFMKLTEHHLSYVQPYCPCINSISARNLGLSATSSDSNLVDTAILSQSGNQCNHHWCCNGLSVCQCSHSITLHTLINLELVLPVSSTRNLWCIFVRQLGKNSFLGSSKHNRCQQPLQFFLLFWCTHATLLLPNHCLL